MKANQLDLYLEEILDKYWEWLEMGYPFEDLLYSLLKQEHKKNQELELRLSWNRKEKNTKDG